MSRAVRESVQVAGRSERARVVRAFVAAVLGPAHPCGDDAVLLVSELFGNSVRHSNSALPGQTVTVTVTACARAIRVEVTDRSGPGVPRLRPAADDAETGRGLALVAGLATRWGWQRWGGRTVTWFSYCGTADVPAVSPAGPPLSTVTIATDNYTSVLPQLAASPQAPAPRLGIGPSRPGLITPAASLTARSSRVPGRGLIDRLVLNRAVCDGVERVAQGAEDSAAFRSQPSGLTIAAGVSVYVPCVRSRRCRVLQARRSRSPWQPTLALSGWRSPIAAALGRRSCALPLMTQKPAVGLGSWPGWPRSAGGGGVAGRTRCRGSKRVTGHPLRDGRN